VALRASSIAVAAPLQRAPTTIASTVLVPDMRMRVAPAPVDPLSSRCRRRRAGLELLGGQTERFAAGGRVCRPG
jgi:hypothetical protein